MYDIMIATNVAQEQDRSILPELEKGEDRASAPPSSAAPPNNSPHTILCVFCVRREWVSLGQGMMADDQALQGQSTHLANGGRGRSQLLPYQPHGFTASKVDEMAWMAISPS